MIKILASLSVKILKIIGTLVLLILPLSYFLIATESGLKLDLYLIKMASGNKFSFKKARGNLLNDLAIEDVSFQSNTLTLTVKQLTLNWSMIKSLNSGLSIDNLALENVSVLSKNVLTSSPKKKRATNKLKQPILNLSDIKSKRDDFLNALKNIKFTLKKIKIEKFNFKSPNNKLLVRSLHLSADSDGSKLKITTLNTQFENENIAIKGMIDFDNNFSSNITFNSTGETAFTGQLSGSLKKYHFQTDITQPFNANVDFTLTKQFEFSGAINGKNISLPFKSDSSVSMPSLAIKIAGSLDNYFIKTNGELKILQLPKHLFNLNATGDLSSLTLKQFKISSGISSINLQAQLHLQPQLTWQSQLHVNHLQANLYRADLPEDINLQINSDGALNTTKRTGLLDIFIKPGYLKLDDNNLLNFQGGKLSLEKINNKITAKGLLTLDPNKSMTLSLLLPNVDNTPLASQTMQGDIKLKINDIKVLETFIPSLSKSHGKLAAMVYLNGALLSPKIKTDVLLENAQTDITSMGLTLKNINMRIKGTATEYFLNGSLVSDKGTLMVNGKASFINSSFISKLNLNGSNISVFNTDEYKIHASPTLELNSHDKNILISGDIGIDSADIKPQDFSSTVELPDDVLILGEQEQDNSPLNFGYKLNLTLGEKSNVFIEGLQGKIKGSILLNAPIHQSFRATGTVDIVDGTYKAYGQDLTITQGKFIYAGGPINNPGIFLQASRSFNVDDQYSTDLTQGFSPDTNKIIVGLTVKGRLKSPQSELFSVPSSRSQSDILSMLVLGKPISQATDSGSDSALSSSQLLLSALTKLNIGGSSGQQLTDQLKHAFGIDELNLESQSHYDSETNTVNENTALVIGKSLSSKLSMHYSIGLSQGTSLLRIKYQFSPRWAIQTESSGNTNGMDLIFNYHK